MKILFLANYQSIHTIRWVNALVNCGHEVHLISQQSARCIKMPDEINSAVNLHLLKWKGTKGYYLNAPELIKLFKHIKPDIVNAHYASGYGTLARLAKIHPLILNVWGSDVYDFPSQSALKLKIIKSNLLNADKIASTSYCMGEEVNKILSPQRVDYSITPFGVDTQLFKPKYLKKDHIVIGNIKTLEMKYGIDCLIKAIKTLVNRLNLEHQHKILAKLRVEIYGKGSQKENLENLIDELNLSKYVYLMGYITHDRVPDVLNGFDIFCCTSELNSESFGVSVVEAMAMELPVVCTDVDGFKEVMQDNLTGYIVKRRDYHNISEKLYNLIMDKELRLEMGIEGRKRVIKNYNWTENVKVMEKVYDNVLNSQKNRK